SLRKRSGAGTMIRSRSFQWKGYGERTMIGGFGKVGRTVAKLAGALIPRERKLPKVSECRRHNRQSRPVENATGLRRGCSRTLGQTSKLAAESKSRTSRKTGRQGSE